MPHIDYYFSTISPYVYLSGTRMEDVANRHGATITYKPLDILSLFGRTGGVPPKDRHPNRLKWRAQELPRQARKLGLPLNIKPASWPTNAAPSSYAIIAASKTDGGDVGKLVHAIGRACWAEEKDIAEDHVIKACLADAGFDPSLSDSGMLSSAETYERNLEDAINDGVFGTPFYVLDKEHVLWGQDRIEDLDLVIQGKI